MSDLIVIRVYILVTFCCPEDRRCFNGEGFPLQLWFRYKCPIMLTNGCCQYFPSLSKWYGLLYSCSQVISMEVTDRENTSEHNSCTSLPCIPTPHTKLDSAPVILHFCLFTAIVLRDWHEIYSSKSWNVLTWRNLLRIFPSSEINMH